MASSQLHSLKPGRALTQDASERTMEQYLIEQYLARIGYASDLNPGPDIKAATIEDVQSKILHQLKVQHAAQQAPATIPSRPARMPDLREGIPPNTPSTTSTPGPEASHHAFVHGYESELPSPPPTPPPPKETEILAAFQAELEHRQKICQGIEHQIEACQKEIRAHPSEQKKIEKEHEERMAQLMKPMHDGKQKPEKRESTKTAEEAELEEMRDIYQQYDRELAGVPTAESVDALFVVIAKTEDRFRKTEEANKAATRREAKLEERLYKARCAMFEMEDKIEEVENGGTAAIAEEFSEPNVEKGRTEAQRGSKRRSRRGKGVKDGRQGRGEGGEGRRRKRRRKGSGKAGKMSLDTAPNK